MLVAANVTFDPLASSRDEEQATQGAVSSVLSHSTSTDIFHFQASSHPSRVTSLDEMYPTLRRPPLEPQKALKNFFSHMQRRSLRHVNRL